MKDFIPPAHVNVVSCASVEVTKTGSDGGSQAGAVFTLYEGTDTTGAVVGTCTVDADGDCLPTFDSLAPGTYTIDETSVPAGYTKDPDLPDTFTVAVGDVLELSYTNVAAPGSVEITKVDDGGDPVAGAVFTLFSPAGHRQRRTDGYRGRHLHDRCRPATCTISGVTPGPYTIDETLVPSGYAKDAAFPKNITISNGETEVVTAADPRQFKTIVLVCNEVDDTLYPSAITIDGQSAGNSLSSAQAATAGLGRRPRCAASRRRAQRARAAPHAATRTTRTSTSRTPSRRRGSGVT